MYISQSEEGLNTESNSPQCLTITEATNSGFKVQSKYDCGFHSTQEKKKEENGPGLILCVP